MTCIEYITKADIFGIQAELLYKGHTRHKTLLGASLTILIVCLFLAGFFYFGKDLYQKNNPIVISSSSINSNVEELQITPFSFPFQIGIQDRANNLNFFKKESVYKLKANLRTQKRVLNDKGIIELITKKIPVNLIDCDLKTNFPKMEKDFNSTAYQLAYCIDPNQNITIKGDFNNEEFFILQVDMFQCFNTTESQSCLPQSEIDKSIRNTYVSINYGQYIVRPGNYSSPMERQKQDFFTTISNNGVKQLNIYLKRIYTKTDSGIIFEENHINTYNQVEKIQELASNIIPAYGERMLNIGIRMSYTEDIITRNYIKVQTVVANVGGLLKFFIIIFQSIIILLTKDSYYLEILNQIFYTKNKTILSKDDKSSMNPSNMKIYKKLNFHFSKSEVDAIPSEVPIKPNLNLNRNILKLNLWNYLKLIFNKSNLKNNFIYKRGKLILQKLMDINHFINKFLEYERFKKVVLDNNQMILFNTLQGYDIESDEYLNNNENNFLLIQEAFHHLNISKKKKNANLLKLIDKSYF